MWICFADLIVIKLCGFMDVIVSDVDPTTGKKTNDLIVFFCNGIVKEL